MPLVLRIVCGALRTAARALLLVGGFLLSMGAASTAVGRTGFGPLVPIGAILAALGWTLDGEQRRLRAGHERAAAARRGFEVTAVPLSADDQRKVRGDAPGHP